MAFPVNSRSTGYLVPATTWNADIVDNLNALNTDLLFAQADIVVLEDATDQGTWTPSFNGSGGQSGQVYSLQEGVYARHDNVVHCWGVLTLSTKGTITGDLQLAGLPFPVANLGSQETVFPVRFFALATNWITIAVRPLPGNSIGYIVGLQAAGTSNGVLLTTADLGNTSSMRVHCAYITP